MEKRKDKKMLMWCLKYKVCKFLESRQTRSCLGTSLIGAEISGGRTTGLKGVGVHRPVFWCHFTQKQVFLVNYGTYGNSVCINSRSISLVHDHSFKCLQRLFISLKIGFTCVSYYRYTVRGVYKAGVYKAKVHVRPTFCCTAKLPIYMHVYIRPNL